jgi:phenylpropionate dioxygenase-like ring-hydroxylating dioxygenase large terminal subunit
MFRSIWLPAVRSDQLGGPNTAPVRLKLLGEQLVAFRDGTGAAGIVQAHCVHRRAPLFFGKVEEHGLRCSYHGWLYNREGQCIQIPSDAQGTLCKKMKLAAYRTAEKGGIVWIFMGDTEAPALPAFPWMDLPADQRTASVWLQESNWFQGAEGEIDSSHVSILHKTLRQMSKPQVHRLYTYRDPMPQLSTHETPIGFMSIARRKAEEQFYWRVTQWMAPMFSFVPSAAWPIGGRAWVPIDDENTYTWDFVYSPDGPLPDEYRESIGAGASFPPKYEYAAVALNTGSIVDTWQPSRNRRNDYEVDRSKQLAGETTGIFGVNDQDRAVQEGMGRIVDRTKEKLVAADAIVVAARRRILSILASPESLDEFRRLIRDGTAFSVHPIDAVESTGDVEEFLRDRALA